MCKEYHKRTVYRCGHERMRTKLIKCFLSHKQRITAIEETTRYRRRTVCRNCALEECQVEERRKHKGKATVPASTEQRIKGEGEG